MAILGFLSSIRKVVADLDARWTSTRGGYLDRLNTDYSNALALALGTTNTRVDKAISTRMRAPICTVYTTGTAQTYNARHANSLLHVILVGGGGGGGDGASYGGGGGGGGETLTAWIRLMGSTSVTYTVGAGGSGGASTAGVAGGNTSFGYLLAAGGGAGKHDTGMSLAYAEGGYGGGFLRYSSAYDDGASGTGYSEYVVHRSGLSICGGAGGFAGSDITILNDGKGPGFGDRNHAFDQDCRIHLSGVGIDNIAGGGGGSMYGTGGAGGNETGGGAGTGYGAGGGGNKGAGNGGAGSGGLIIVYDYGNVDDGAA